MSQPGRRRYRVPAVGRAGRSHAWGNSELVLVSLGPGGGCLAASAEISRVTARAAHIVSHLGTATVDVLNAGQVHGCHVRAQDIVDVMFSGHP